MPDPTPSPGSYRLWPAVAVTVLTGLGFAGLKFVLITRMALTFEPAHIEALPAEWMKAVMRACAAQGLEQEAISQGMAAILTLGVFLGFAVNSPLSGALRAGPMFAASCAALAVLALATIGINPWLLAAVIGITYGAACAARGKVIPLLAEGTGRHNTTVSGVINAALVVGLLAGTVAGVGLGQAFVGSQSHALDAAGVRTSAFIPAALVDAPWMAHAVIAALFAGGAVLSFRVRTPDAPVIPFGHGLRHLAGDTWAMLRSHWALLISGGLIWGVASAASLAVLVWSIKEVGLDPVTAATISVFAAVGAIAGNLVSSRFNRRRWVILSLLLLGGSLLAVPWLVQGYVSGAAAMVGVGVFFSIPTNIVDARLLHLANEEGLPGRGSTVMSLLHNVFILVVGLGLAVPLFLGAIDAYEQFVVLAAFTVAAAAVAFFAELRREGGTTRITRPVP
ncbi:MAG: hypothetical protein RLZZ127_2314 [Planctomycetota bacterium]|jgi:MFS family permease